MSGFIHGKVIKVRRPDMCAGQPCQRPDRSIEVGTSADYQGRGALYHFGCQPRDPFAFTEERAGWCCGMERDSGGFCRAGCDV